MLKELPWDSLVWLYLLLLMRFSGWDREDPKGWKEVVMVAIPKPGTDKKGMEALRLISLLPVLQKTYVRMLQLAETPERSADVCNVLGYRAGCSPADVSESARLALAKADEWGLPIAIASADVLRAFEQVRHADIAESLLSKKVHPEFVHAYMQELAGVSASIFLPGASPSEHFKYERGVKMGGVDGPDQFNSVLDHAIGPCARRWKEEGRGFKLREDYRRLKTARMERLQEDQAIDQGIAISHQVWADNFYAYGGTGGELRHILQDATDSLEEKGLFWKQSSLEVIAGTFSELQPGSVMRVQSRLGHVWDFRIVSSMEVLGVLLDRAGSSMASVRHRIAKATKHFYAIRGPV